MQIEYSRIVKWFRYNHPNKMDRLWDSLSPNQIIGKQWLVNSLQNVQIPRDENGQFRVEIVGGWYGYPLIDLLMSEYPGQIKEIDIFELDEFATKVIYRYSQIFGHTNVRIFHQDYFTYQETRRTHMVINTSCEHMWDMSHNKECYESPDRTLLVLQSNNKRDEIEHINCVDSCQELLEKNELSEMHGDWKRMNQGTPDKFIRFMVMGKWK